MKNVLLITNKIMHYRIPVFNYFVRSFKKEDFKFIVRSKNISNYKRSNVDFEYKKIKLDMKSCIEEIRLTKPVTVLFSLHLKDLVMFPLLLWLRMEKIPVISWKHGINLQDRRNIIKNLFFRHIHNMSDAIILFSPNEKRYICDKNQHKIFVAPNTLNFFDIPKITLNKKDLREKYNIKFKKNVLFVGRIQPRKRLDDLLKVFKEINKDIGLIVVGPGITKKQLERIKKMRNVNYFGPLFNPTTINEIFKMSDVFCIPGTNGLGLNHAFYWGLPAITEDVYHSPEIYYLRSGENGYIVPEGDIKALREKLEFLLSDDEVYEKFSAEAKKTIEEEGNIKNMSDGFINCIKWVLKK